MVSAEDTEVLRTVKGGIDVRRVRLIGMGGTITFSSSDEGAVPTLRVDELADQLGLQVDTVEVMAGSSIGITQAELRGVIAEVDRARAEGYAGAVVAHGTDTMEETVYLVALALERGFPTAFTGAMHHHGETATDGPGNLLDAIDFVLHPGAAGVGPVVVMDGQVHVARFVAKADTSSTAAFQSPGAGPIGAVTEHRPSLWFRPAYNDYVGPLDRLWPRVELLHLVSATDAGTLTAILDTQPAGIVIAGYGGGHVHPSLLETLARAVRTGIPIVVASRCQSGDTLRCTYGVPGTEIDLQQRGLLMAGRLSAVKARLRLSVGLANGVPAEQLFPVD